MYYVRFDNICRPPSVDSNSVRVERIPLKVRDGEGLLSTNTYELVISITPTDTLSPIVTKNTGTSSNVQVCQS